MATTGKTVADYTCRQCGVQGHTARTCSKRAASSTPKKPSRPVKPPRAERELAVEVRADAPAANEIAAECDAIKAMLLAKNAAYGNSALDPVRIFSKASPVEQLLVRLDDKLSRIARGTGAETEDVEGDAIGYLVLLRIARRQAVA